MAKTNFGLDFTGFKRLSNKINELGNQYLEKATINALTMSKDYANQKVEEAMDNSIYHFKKTKGSRATGNALKVAKQVAAMPVDVVGGFVFAYVGVSWSVAPEVTYLAYGTPHIAADFRLHNAIKVNGSVKKEVLRIQQEEFNKVLKEAMNND